MKLSKYQDKAIRLQTVWGETFEGLADVFPPDYGELVFDRGEESVRLGSYYAFRRDIRRIERISPRLLCDFFGAELVPTPVRRLYRKLRPAWCAETCEPSLRALWSPEEPGLGQSGPTAFLVQELFGGRVCGFAQEGGVRCFNLLGDHSFDLTARGEDAEAEDYLDRPEQSREAFFADPENRERYARLKERLRAN